MTIQYDQVTRTFHLKNQSISYIMKILPDGQIGQLYFGESVRREGGFDHLLEPAYRPMSSYVFEGDRSFSLEHVRQEYPVYGTGDYRHPAIVICEKNGSRISEFHYVRHEITDGKPGLEGLPAIYCDHDSEAQTLQLILQDSVSGVEIVLCYTIFEAEPAIARSVKIRNGGSSAVSVEQAMSLCLDLPDAVYEWVQLSGAWGRERHIYRRKLCQGIQSVESTRGNSSHMHNPFVALKRPETTEFSGEVIGFSLIYSGNFLAQAEVDTYDVTRMMIGINPFGFSWKLEPQETLQLPEAVMVFSRDGLNGMSQVYHKLFRDRLVRGCWRNRVRPILINSWESMGYNLSEEKLLAFARKAKDCGIEMLVLDDGWFGNRTSDKVGLGDWDEVRSCFPSGISGLAEKIKKTGLQFGIWIEPEMVNRDSNLYRKHPDWLLQAPGRRLSHGRNELVLDFTRKDVVDYLYDVLKQLIEHADISYIKWDMNRSITGAYACLLEASRQGEVFHRYILGVYELYERLIRTFPGILFESCASGGGRFDPGMLYYAPQCWLSDDTDAIERIYMQYGTSLCYPVSSFGTHVSASPNQQVYRSTSLRTRANVAYFGTFGYELDLGELTEDEICQIRGQVTLMKQYRALFQFGTFYRLISPFENRQFAAWMTVSADRKTAIVGWYKIMNEVNGPFHRVRLQGLNPAENYKISVIGACGEIKPLKSFSADVPEQEADSIEVLENNCKKESVYGGDELLKIGLVTTDSAAGELRNGVKPSCDFDSQLYLIQTAERM
ncbi:MAG: alpha-galactosidase [Eubacterium sp.]|nr:alpha-galactosidase [Eubacterium sp.]